MQSNTLKSPASAKIAEKLNWTHEEGLFVSLAKNGLIPIEWEGPPNWSNEPRLRDETTSGPQLFLADIQTTRLFDESYTRRLAIFRCPKKELEAALEDAERRLAVAQADEKLTETSPGQEKLEKLKHQVGVLVDDGKHAELARVSKELAQLETMMNETRRERARKVKQTEAMVAAAKANLELYKQASHRYLRLERGAINMWSMAATPEKITEHVSSERVRAVESRLTISLTEWCNVDIAKDPAPFPISWLKLLVAIRLPDIATWARERFEELPAGAPASAGIRATEMHQRFLKEHDLTASQVAIEAFGAALGEVFPKKHGNSGNFYMCRRHRTDAEREAELLAQFQAEKAEQERREFEAWKASRATAGSAGAGG